jgi:amino acid adenylation domain-containing protein
LNSNLSQLSPEERVELERRLLRRTHGASKAGIPRRTPGIPCPLSHAQQRLWFLDQYEPGSAVYNIPMAWSLHGRLDLDALQRAFQTLVDRHEALRTTFATLEDVPIQVVAPRAPVPFAVVDLGPGSPEQRAAELQRRLEQLGAQPFDLTRDVMIRAYVFRRAADDHVLLLNMHHIASDGWSIDIVIRELSALYRGFATGADPSLPELPIQYADYAVWQREWLSGAMLEKQLAYWRGRLEGAPPTLELPADASRHQVTGSHSGSRTLALSTELSGRLEELGRSAGATLFMTLLAAFQIVAGRLAGRSDVVVGTPIAGRNREAIESLVGFFVNTLVLRLDLSDAPSFREVLRRVRQSTLDAYSHQDLPFEKLVEELHPERSLHRTPLFQVFFNMLNTAGEELRLPELHVEWIAPPAIDSKFDLTLYARPRPEGVLLTAVYNSELFHAARIEEFLAQFERFLTVVAADPDRRADQVSLITASAERSLPDPMRPLGSTIGPPLHERFAEQATRTPNQVAVADPNESWTYAELETRSNQLAHRLLELGVAPGNLVAIYAHRSASLVWAMLGVWKAGAAFVLLDPALPTVRLIDSLKQARPRVWLELAAAGSPPKPIVEFLATQSALGKITLPSRSRATASRFLADRPPGAPSVSLTPESLAYVAFTSGSTGTPKGILGTHGPLSHFVPWHVETFELSAQDRFSLLSGLAHDPLLRDLFTPLAIGATLVIPDPDELASTRLADWLARERITIAHLTPALGQVLARGSSSNSSPITSPDVRWLFFGGDRLTRRDVEAARAWAPNAQCVNFYGTTETPQAMGWHRAAADSDLAPEVYPVGNGIRGAQILVLNRAGAHCGVGELGEIHVRTPHLSRGYLDDPALTQERYLTNPFSGQAEDRMYRTGDLGRYRIDGTVDFVGRADEQVKIRGHRIEPAEIEAILRHHDHVGDALALVQGADPASSRLVAYVVARNGQRPDPRDLRTFLRERLPEFMIPSAYVVLDRMPLTANGKIDRSALPAPESRAVESASVDDQSMPRTPAEKMIASVWQELLQVDRVTTYDNFLDLGGHSLLGLEVIARVKRQHGVEIRPRELMFQSLGQIASACTERMGGATKPSGLGGIVGWFKARLGGSGGQR